MLIRGGRLSAALLSLSLLFLFAESAVQINGSYGRTEIVCIVPGAIHFLRRSNGTGTRGRRYFMLGYPVSYVRYIPGQIVDLTCFPGIKRRKFKAFIGAGWERMRWTEEGDLVLFFTDIFPNLLPASASRTASFLCRVSFD